MTDTATPNIEGPGKGKAFFDRARTVAATGNFDYAIDMYIEGLNREPFNLDEHKALREVGMRRKIAGGKAPSGFLGVKTPYKGKTPKEAMLNAEFVLGKDVGNLQQMIVFVRNAAALAQDEERDLPTRRQIITVAVWMAGMARENNRTSKSPKLEVFNELADHLEKLEEYNEASRCIQLSVQLKPTDMELISRAKDLAAKETLKKGNYEKAEDFKESIKDKEVTKELLQEENLNKSEEYRLKAITQARADYEKNPREVQVINKYYKALAEMDEESYENQAIDMLTKAYADTQIYRWKAGVGDLKMKQFNRNLRMLKDAHNADPNDKEIKQQYENLMKEKLAFELNEFRERSDNFPTDMHVKYEFGRRLFATHHYDEAIAALQEAQSAPQHRVDALHLLGLSFLSQKMVPEAVDTFKKSIDEYDLASTGDKKAKELYYWYARGLEEARDFPKAIETYSQIIRWDIAYRDARKRLNELREQAKNTPPPQNP
jgi:tetratricopeptide (TPR) repeat protein